MSRQIQIRRGSADENDVFTGAIGEITMDTTNKTLRIHDGTTAGGTPLATRSEIQDFGSIPEDKARQLIGNRVWISGEYSLSASANVVVSHNLNLSAPMKALAIPYFKFTSNTEGYSTGDIISNAVMPAILYTPGDYNSVDGYGPFLNVYQNTVIIPMIRNVSNGLFIFNKNTGARKLIASSNIKVFVKIIY